MMRFIAWTLIVALAAGCATAKPQPTRTEAEEKMARDQQECAQLAAAAAESAGMAETMRGVGLLGFYLVLLGASEGVRWGVVTGGSRSDGAWIGAGGGGGGRGGGGVGGRRPPPPAPRALRPLPHRPQPACLMRWLVDGYNVIRRAPELAARERETLQAGREALCRLLSTAAPLPGGQVNAGLGGGRGG